MNRDLDMNNTKALAEALKKINAPDDECDIAVLPRTVNARLIEQVVTAYSLYGNESSQVLDKLVGIYSGKRFLWIDIDSIMAYAPKLLINSDHLLDRLKTERVYVMDFKDYLRGVHSSDDEE